MFFPVRVQKYGILFAVLLRLHAQATPGVPRHQRRMASKRGLTGGTDDVNPQWITISTAAIPVAAVTQTNVTVVQAQVPVYPVGASSKNEATIVEILRVQAFIDPEHTLTVAIGTAQVELIWWLGHQALTPGVNVTGLASMSIATDRVLSGLVTMGIIEEATASDGVSVQAISRNNPMWDQDLTDGAGHGVLYANPTINLSVKQQTDSISLWTSWNMVVRILFRYKRVGLTEYIGIVQTTV